jgi:hypothetical protein
MTARRRSSMRGRGSGRSIGGGPAGCCNRSGSLYSAVRGWIARSVDSLKLVQRNSQCEGSEPQ